MNCRTLLHMHNRTCMCGALGDLRAPSPFRNPLITCRGTWHSIHWFCVPWSRSPSHALPLSRLCMRPGGLLTEASVATPPKRPQLPWPAVGTSLREALTPSPAVVWTSMHHRKCSSVQCSARQVYTGCAVSGTCGTVNRGLSIKYMCVHEQYGIINVIAAASISEGGGSKGLAHIRRPFRC